MKQAMSRALISIVCLAVPLLASGEYSPYLQSDYPQNVYFGDTHLHTSFSIDAGMVGDKLGPDEAYRFAKGQVVTASLGAHAAGPDGKLPAIESTVENAAYNNRYGAAQLTAVWRDPDFDTTARAFYYVRVLEIPTPTWLAYDKDYYGDAITLPDDARLVHQERSYSAPIWYSRARKND